MRKLNASGFAHQIAIMAVVVVLAVGGIGSYIYLKSSSAATPTPASLCGSGFVVQKQKRLKYSNGTKAPAILYLLKKASKGRVCSVLMSTGSAYGKSKPMKVALSVWDGYRTTNNTCVGGDFGPYVDSGTYKYYAGPEKAVYNSNRALNITNGYIMACAKATGNMTYAGKSASARIDVSTW